MAKITDNLKLLSQTKTDIKNAIEQKGQSLENTPFTKYAEKILKIVSGGGVEDLDFVLDEQEATIEDLEKLFAGMPIDKEPILQEKFVDPDVVEKIIEADSGYDGLSKVHLTAVTSAIDSNILADNIKKDVTILGVTGTLESAVAEDLTEELTAQDTALDELETAVDKLPEPKPDRMQWVCDNVYALKNTFEYYAGTSLDDVLNGLDTSRVTNMYRTFYGCNNLTSIPQLDTSKVTNMEGTFYACQQIIEFPLFNTSKVSRMIETFSTCKALMTIPQLDTSSCTEMTKMFYSCEALTSIPQLDTSNVTDMQRMFYGCKVLNTIPKLNTSKATNMSYMFYGCSALTTISELDMIKVTSTSSMFSACEKLTNLTLKNIKATLSIGNGTVWGRLLTDASLLNTAQELWDNTGNALGGARTLSMATAKKTAIQSIYVKLIDITDDMRAEDQYIDNKKPFVVCESTDEGAMTLQEYIISKNWGIA